MSKNHLAISIFLGLALVLSQGNAIAAEEGENLAKAFAKARYLLKKMKKDLTQMQMQLDDANERLKEIPVLKKKLKNTKKDLAASVKQVNRLEIKLDVTEKRRARTYDRLEELAEKFKEHRKALHMVVNERNNLEQKSAKQKIDLTTCESKNKKLYQANLEMGERYENKSCTDTESQKDGITGLKQAEIENILEEYNRKIDGLRVKVIDEARSGS
jgi:chromosome segregation ATPase